MSRPTLEVADIVRATGNRFWEQQQSHLAWPHRKVLEAIVRCRTAALGGHRDQCVRCGHQAISFNSCRNRHCPKCQGTRANWLAARSAACHAGGRGFESRRSRQHFKVRMIEAISALMHWIGWFASGYCALRQSRNSLDARPKRCDRLLNHESLIRQVRRNALDCKECGEANAGQGSPY